GTVAPMLASITTLPFVGLVERISAPGPLTPPVSTIKPPPVGGGPLPAPEPAPARFAFCRLAFEKLSPERLSPERLADFRLAPARSAPERLLLERLAP